MYSSISDKIKQEIISEVGDTLFSIIFLEDKHKVLLHLSIFYEYQQLFSTPYLFLDTAATSTRIKKKLLERANLGHGSL
jgi:hypothetical protein